MVEIFLAVILALVLVLKVIISAMVITHRENKHEYNDFTDDYDKFTTTTKSIVVKVGKQPETYSLKNHKKAMEIINKKTVNSKRDDDIQI